MPSPNQYLLGGSDPSPILAPSAPSQPTPWYLDPQQRGAVTSVLSALAAPLTDAYQHAANLAQGRGDYGMELTSGLLAAAGMAAPPAARGAATAAEELAPAVENAVARGIRAYHGSPYDFGQFDASKIGTGEGAQAYGHGLYFAQAEPTAESYVRNAKWKYGGTNADTIYDRVNNPALERGLDNEGWSKLNAQRGFWEKVVLGRSPRQIIGDAQANPDQYGENELAYIQSLKPEKFKRVGGHMYEVNINADPEHFLDWDKPLSEQSAKVKSALTNAAQGNPNISHLVDQKAVAGERGNMPASAILGAMRSTGVSDEGISGLLREAGVPGIKYLDQGSRGAGEGTHNYVVFDPATIDIIRKYGIAALMGGGAAAAGAGMTPQPAQAGQDNVSDTIRALQSQ